MISRKQDAYDGFELPRLLNTRVIPEATLYSEDSSSVSGQRRVSTVSLSAAVGFVEPVTASTIGPGGARDGVGVD